MQSTSFLDATLFVDLELITKLLTAWLDEDVVEELGQAERDRASGLPVRLVISESSIPSVRPGFYRLYDADTIAKGAFSSDVIELGQYRITVGGDSYNCITLSY